MAKEFQSLLFSLSQQLNQQEVNKLVAANQLPGELRGQPPAVVLDHLEQIGKFTSWKLERIMEAMKDIGRNDLYKQVKLFRKKTRKSYSGGIVPAPPGGEKKLNFEPAETQATQVRATLQMMEEAVIARNVGRVEEVYSEAREAADNLVRIIKRANCLARTLCSASKSPSAPPPPTPYNGAAVPGQQGFGNMPQAAPEPTMRMSCSLKRSQSERKVSVKPVSRRPPAPTIPIPPTPFERDTHSDSDSDGDGSAEYDTADIWSWSNTLPRSLPSQRPTMPPSPMHGSFGKPAVSTPPPPPAKLTNNAAPVSTVHHRELPKVNTMSLLVRPAVPSVPRTSVPSIPSAPFHNDSDNDGTLNYEDASTALASHQGLLAKRQQSAETSVDTSTGLLQARAALRRTSVKHSSPNNTLPHPTRVLVDLPEKANNMTMSSNPDDSSSTCTVDSGFDEFPPTPPLVRPRPTTKSSSKSNHFNTVPLKSSHHSRPPVALPEKDYTNKDGIPTQPVYINVPKYVCPD